MGNSIAHLSKNIKHLWKLNQITELTGTDRGRIKEKWGKLTNNDFGEIEGRGKKLLGLLQKRYGYIREKAELEYQDSVELAAIVSNIRDVMTQKKDVDVMTIAFIARYGKPLSAKKQESQITGTDEKHG